MNRSSTWGIPAFFRELYREPMTAREPSRRPFVTPMAILFIAAIFLRMWFLHRFGTLLFPDSLFRYLPIGVHAPERWLGSVYDTPGYPLFISAVHHGPGLYPWLQLGQAVLDGLTALMVLDMGRRLDLGIWAWPPALIMGLGAHHIAFSNAVLSETLFCFLTVGCCWWFLLLRSRPDRGYGYFAGLGLWVAALTLTRANGVLFLALFTFAGLWFSSLKGQRGKWILFGSCAVVPILAWVGYNYHSRGLLGIAQGSGWQFLQATSYHGLLVAEDLPAEDRDAYTDLASLYRIRAKHFDPAKPRRAVLGYDRQYRDIALSAVRRDPLGYLRGVVSSMRLPTQEIYDMSKLPLRQGNWTHHRNLAAKTDYLHWMPPYHEQGLFRRLYGHLMVLSFKNKMPILMLFSLCAWLYAVYRKRPYLFLLGGLPFLNGLPLLLMLNPIDRYFYPFEPLLWLTLFAVPPLVRRAAFGAPASDRPGWRWWWPTADVSALGSDLATGSTRVIDRGLVIVPAYNEADNLPTLLDRFGDPEGWDLLVVNDGSSDDTAEILARSGVRHINLPMNLGIGGAMQTGYRFAFENGYSRAIQMDGDGQHQPEQIARLETALAEADCVIGSRFLERRGYQSTPLRLLGIRMISWTLYLMSGRRIRDCTSGMRMVNRRVLALFANHYPHDFPEPESLAMLLRAGCRVVEVPVEMAERGGGASSIQGLKSVLYMIQVIPKVVLSSIFRRFV
ncbi:Glycosyltransferase [Sulfidibacter corallicola]|uniref:Glycosyltransferase n=1 Tax=Sulfidibacter corallicola TaxID=2818388 RepID=A0A8A4TIG7_SULCO|nr:glycosyltransferase [Sulfidibacter corallicola]QTD49287.1 glycosyltransferase [Sulfidibacter corallicola]